MFSGVSWIDIALNHWYDQGRFLFSSLRSLKNSELHRVGTNFVSLFFIFQFQFATT